MICPLTSQPLEAAVGKTRRRIASRRLVATVLLVCLLGAVLVAVGFGSADAQTVSDNADAASSVRIAARKLENGNIEFGLQVAGGDLWLPRARFFSYATVEVGRWLRASPYGMSDGNDVRVRARKLANGKVEFALQVGADRQWLPPTRNFPYRTATVGRWLYASWYTVGDPTTPLDSSSRPSTGERSSCTLESTMSKVLPSVFQVVTDRGLGTAFYIGDNKFLTAAHVIEGARTIRLQNHERTLRQIESTWIDAPSDIAILVVAGSGIPALGFGEESSVSRGGPVAVVGYPGDNFDVSTPYPASITSGLLSTRASDSDHDYVFYLRTDAAANPGNSGGPLITVCGEVLGLMSWKIVAIDVEGLSWAVSEQTIREVLRRPLRVEELPRSALPTSAWRFFLDDDGEPILYSVSEVYEYENARGNEDPPGLIITCQSDQLRVFVYWDAFVAADVWTDEIAVEYRFDNAQWISEGWDELPPTYTSAWAPSPRPFVSSARSADTVTIWIWNFDDELAGGAVFQLDGLDAGLRGMTCY